MELFVKILLTFGEFFTGDYIKSLFQSGKNLAVFGKTAERFLGKNQLTIFYHFKDTSAGRN